MRDAPRRDRARHLTAAARHGRRVHLPHRAAAGAGSDSPAPALADRAAGGDAVELFALRAAAAVPGFTVTPENVADVIRLCRRLDGMPLAIELAAVQLRALPLGELLDRLNHRFTVLAAGRPGALPRHQTLRTAIEWSHELCSAAERRLWARLSVFAGPFSLDAAEEVCAEVALERPDVMDALIGLVDKSVVLREGERYRMLDTLREFGAEQLAASGELASCRARHIARYLAMARYFGVHFADDDQMDRYHELREVHPNLRAALEYALEPDDGPLDAEAGAELACSLYGYWQISGLLGEGGYWLTKVLDRFPAPGRSGRGRWSTGGSSGRSRGTSTTRSPTARPGPRWRSRSATTPSRPAGTSTRCSRSPSSGGTRRR